jgi:uncharacterized membrane protein YeaQ/YmgE (transglycosylase-associated protein family)
MPITGVITAILIGIVVGVLGRLVVPGRQPIGMLVTILVGIVSAFIGTAIAERWESRRSPTESTGSNCWSR